MSTLSRLNTDYWMNKITLPVQILNWHIFENVSYSGICPWNIVNVALIQAFAWHSWNSSVSFLQFLRNLNSSQLLWARKYQVLDKCKTKLNKITNSTSRLCYFTWCTCSKCENDIAKKTQKYEKMWATGFTVWWKLTNLCCIVARIIHSKTKGI